jgi:outer membrane lipoprotein-sorting protein
MLGAIAGDKRGTPMHWLLTSALVTSAIAQVGDPEAARLLRKMGEKILAAKALKVTYQFDAPPGPGGGKKKGVLLLGEGNRLRWEDSLVGDGGQDLTTLIVCDGKQLVSSGPLSWFTKRVPARPTLGKAARRAFSQLGLLLLETELPQIEGGKEKPSLPIGNFKRLEDEQLAGRDAQVIEYMAGIAGLAEIGPIRLWIDAKTGLPLKRQTGKGKEMVTEIYSEIKLNPEIAGDAFSLEEPQQRAAEARKMLLAMEKKIRAARSIKIVLEAEDRGEETSRTTGVVVLAEGNKTRIDLTQTSGKKKRVVKFVTDGKQAFGQRQPFDTEGKAVPIPDGSDVKDSLGQVIARCGVLVSLGPGVDTGGKFNLDQFAPVFNPFLGAVEKVGGREARLLHFQTDLRDRVQVTVWIDEKTLLPLKRRLVWQRSGDVKLTETYSEFLLNTRLNPTLFNMPAKGTRD